MNQRRIPIGDFESVRLRQVAGDLGVIGWTKDEILAEADGDIHVEAVDNVLELGIGGDGKLTLPASLPLSFEVVGGDAHCTGIQAAVDGKRVGGDLRLELTGAFSIAAVGGRARVAHCTGDVRIGAVGGDLVVDSVHGDISASVGGELRITSAVGAIMANAGGDAKLDFATVSDSVSAIQAGGDIHCKLPVEADATLNLQYGGTLRTGGKVAERSTRSHVSRIVLGTGVKTINLLAGGNIVLISAASARTENGEETAGELDDSLRRLTENLGAQLEAMATQLETQLEALPYGDEISARITERLQRAMERAEANVEKAIRRAEKRAAKSTAYTPSARSQREAARTHVPVQLVRAQRDALGDDERAAVLRMVEEKKISPEQAETLLSAMEAH